MGFSFSSRIVWKRRRIARPDHAEEGGEEPADLIDEQRDERQTLGVIWDSAYPPSCGARHERGWAKNPKMLKRQMFGQARLDLLARRFLLTV
jgi:hypothetical protein